jgi:hypothetical protein
MGRLQEFGPPEDVIGDVPGWHRSTPLVWQNGANGFAHWSKLSFPGLTPHLRVVSRLLGPHAQYLGDWLGNLNGDGTNPLNTCGYDSYHLEDHSRGPELGTFETRKGSSTVVDNRAILVTDSYISLYRLASGASTSSESDTSGVDVYCTPVGWLGCYKRSATSKVAHCTTEENHLWDYTS